MFEKNLFQEEIVKVINEFGIRKFDHENHFRLEFKDLMRYRIEKILLVCSLYDYYTIVEDGHLQEAIFNEYLDLNLYYAPHITHAYSGESALSYLKNEKFDLIITTLRLGDMALPDFIKKVKSGYSDIPLVLLASKSRELNMLIERKKLDYIDKIYIWSGDRKIFLAIIKLLEDYTNAPVDCSEYQVSTIILVEDSPDFYSAYLPLIFTELMKQTQLLIEQSRNSAEKLLRQRARPKILHAETYEQAMDYFGKYKKSLLGVITDLKFMHNGTLDEVAGISLIEEIRKEIPDLPILLQTSQEEKRELADKFKVAFANKNSRTLLQELSDYMKLNFGFGDFVFKMPDGIEIQRALNLKELRDKLSYIPNESLLYHSKNNHFSRWLIARTQFELAYKIRPVQISQFSNTKELREYLVNEISSQIIEDQRGVIQVFSRGDFDTEKMFQVIGEGSLGGKARGLAFMDKVLKNYLDPEYFPNIDISIPRTIVIGTNVFDEFIESNNLYRLAVQDVSRDIIIHEFMEASLPDTVLGDLGEILNKVRYPLAIRSSSLLEDAMYQPFAGIYDTIMIPNSSDDFEVRFQNLVQAIKMVYASTFSRNAKNYIEATGNRLEEEKMGVIIQEMVGSKFNRNFYPHISGVARSYNYYTFGKAKPKDGIVNLALGLGKTVVDGGISLQYSPAYPKVFPQFINTKDYFSKAQVKFWAVDLQSDYVTKEPDENMHMVELDISEAEKNKTINYIASTYSGENDMLYEGISRKGTRVINFAPILKTEVFPLNKILKLLLKISEVAMNCPVEIEFAVVLGEDGPYPAQFRFLQVRPMVKPEGQIEFDIDKIPAEKIFLSTDMALGNGVYKPKRVLFVKPDVFDVKKTKAIAEEIHVLNQRLLREEKYYMLIGPGRWGSSDQWLGIPVNFSSISAAQVIIEVPMPHMVVDPSQGSHFFQNITSFKIAYLTVKEGSGLKTGETTRETGTRLITSSDSQNSDKQFLIVNSKLKESKEKQAEELRESENVIDWNWLNSQPVEYETDNIKLVRLSLPLEVLVDGQSGKGVVLK